ncbi:MAG: hypothetical protein Q9M13_01305 [Mariprofundales bacterium]|nr:hypothetical protein [Mariprofundales bacterium]
MIYAITLLLMVSCSVDEHKKTAAVTLPLDTIRIIIKQAALMAVDAACADRSQQPLLIHAAAVQVRRAMGGEEMAQIHKMMNMQPDGDGRVKMSMGAQGAESAEMRSHVALHDTGEELFDFLDHINGESPISCQQSLVVSLAASAAMLRENSNGMEERSAAIDQLDQSATRLLKQSKSMDLPATVRTLALALQQI